MREPEQFVVPALGGLVLLSVFVLGTNYYSLAYLIVLGLLGLGAIGTYFLPPAVQVETRIGIAGLGLLVLLFMFSSIGFWMALVGLGAIGALQIRYRRTLQLPLHTVEWLKTLQSGQEGAAPFAVQADSDAGGDLAAQPADSEQAVGTAATAQPTASAQTGASRRGSMGNIGSIGGIGAAILGVIVLLTAVMPWLSISGYANFSGLELIQTLLEEAGPPIPYAISGALAVLALLSVASVVLPRAVPVITGIAGTAVMVFTFVYVNAALDLSDASDLGVAVNFGIGFWVAALAFILIAVLQAIPNTNKS